MHPLLLRPIRLEDCPIISTAFKAQGWNKPISQYKQYVLYQEQGLRDIIIAESNQEFAGYLTIHWKSDYPPFQKRAIPEVVDFNVLKKFQRLGIGTALMEEAETRTKKVSEYAGIGFGVYQDYGPAQILYIHRGYIPDGNGLVQDGVPVTPGTTLRIDDSVVLYLTKKL